jgi:hypothetical protein
MLASSMLNKINHKHAAYTDIHTIAYTCSGISVSIVVKLGDHVAYYSIHEESLSSARIQITIHWQEEGAVIGI